MKYTFVILFISFAILACRAQDDDDDDVADSDTEVKKGLKDLKDKCKNNPTDENGVKQIIQKVMERINVSNNNDRTAQVIGKVQGMLDKFKDIPERVKAETKKFLKNAKNGCGPRTTAPSSADD